LVIIAVVMSSAICYVDFILSTVSWFGTTALIGTLTLLDSLNPDYSCVSCRGKTRPYLLVETNKTLDVIKREVASQYYFVDESTSIPRALF
jgi:hypothetical protein